MRPLMAAQILKLYIFCSKRKEKNLTEKWNDGEGLDYGPEKASVQKITLILTTTNKKMRRLRLLFGETCGGQKPGTLQLKINWRRKRN